MAIKVAKSLSRLFWDRQAAERYRNKMKAKGHQVSLWSVGLSIVVTVYKKR